MLDSLFNKVAGLQTCNFIKKWLQHRCFPVNVANFIRTAFSIEHLRWLLLCLIFFSIWVFYHDHSRITGLQGKGEGISLTPRYHFHPLHRHLDISLTITAESSPLLEKEEEESVEQTSEEKFFK